MSPLAPAIPPTRKPNGQEAPDDHQDRHLRLLTPGETDRPILDRLHDRLVDATATEQVLDVAYTTMDSPLGLLLLAATENGVVRLAYAREDHDQVLQSLAVKVSPRVCTRRAARRGSPPLDRYFAGRLRSFDLPRICGCRSAFAGRC